MKRLLLFLTVTLFSFSLFSQVVNIETLRLRMDSLGYYGGGDYAGEFYKDKVVHNSAEISVHLAYKGEKNEFLNIGSYSYEISNKEIQTNNAFEHFRYNRIFSKLLTGEVFYQIKFDDVLNVDMRQLIGTGARITGFNEKERSLYFGFLVMYEYEKLNYGEIHNDYRMSNYVTLRLPLKDFKLTSTTYYQPKINDPKDYRISSENMLSYDAGKRFEFFLKFSFLYDTDQVIGIDNYLYSFSQGIKLKLK